MANRKVEEYAHKHGLSNRQAKKRLGKRRFSENVTYKLPERGGPVAGTGKIAASSTKSRKLKAAHAAGR